MLEFRPGQRWFSSAEPELGLGTVLRLAGERADWWVRACRLG